ncbi:hypothetical protein BCR22_01260 [Enterococcus plantarum]|uniref:hypothetical protein n=1 Tax=Enterococcus plantarum TaxID=1077675 RepID=UPI00084D1FFF|nr:hypothetical protein [Enterococcus plantarum]OEG21067.1 hypothetical protein BCR22_01260 [Enterococcus plantarum]
MSDVSDYSDIIIDGEIRWDLLEEDTYEEAFDPHEFIYNILDKKDNKPCDLVLKEGDTRNKTIRVSVEGFSENTTFGEDLKVAAVLMLLESIDISYFKRNKEMYQEVVELLRDGVEDVIEPPEFS